MESLISVLLGWLPFILAVSVWFYVMWKQGFFKKVTFTNQQYMQEMLTETKRQTVALEKLLAQYEERLNRLENKPDGTA
jgi:F0F1-type ATP synthase membrane subunit b/b'